MVLVWLLLVHNIIAALAAGDDGTTISPSFTTLAPSPCGNDPCLNGGTCVVEGESYSCQCEASYTGNNCQTLVDHCDPNPCQHGGVCVSSVSGFTCHCPSGYGGDVCDLTVTDDCLSGPCMYGGTCENTVDGYTCTCVHGRCGNRCQYDIGACDSSPCLNNGTCLNYFNRFKCICSEGFSGRLCQLGPCKSSPCKNGGDCVHENGHFVCRCPHGYTGRFCEEKDCSLVLCPAVYCENPYFPPDECCAVCHEEKPGVCPAPSIGHCAEFCSSDSDCRGIQKCCSNGCGHQCVDPLPQGVDCRLVRCAAPPCENPIYIPGLCCPLCPGHGHQGEGCGRVWCEAPRCHVSQQVLLPGQCCPLCVEPGQCLFGVDGLCGTIAGLSCDDRSQCMFIDPNIADGAGLCCNKVQERGKKGRCPLDLDFRRCFDQCKTDFDCPGVAKCCFNGCAHVCAKPKVYCCDGRRRVNNGDSFPHSDGCNTCHCVNGLVACTKIACVH